MTARRELRALWTGAQEVREQLEPQGTEDAAPAEGQLRALGSELTSAIQRLESAGMLTRAHRARLDAAVSALGKAAAGTVTAEAALETCEGAVEAVALAYGIFLGGPVAGGIGS